MVLLIVLIVAGRWHKPRDGRSGSNRSSNRRSWPLDPAYDGLMADITITTAVIPVIPAIQGLATAAEVAMVVAMAAAAIRLVLRANLRL